MRTQILLPCMLAIPLVGCSASGPWLASPWQSVSSQATGVEGVEYGGDEGPALAANSPNGYDMGSPGAPACLPAWRQPCPPKPCPPKQPKVIRVKVPPQKIVVEAPQKQEQPAKQGAFNPPQEVILVPRTVFMPFVAQTPTGPARVLSLQGAVPLVTPPPEQPQAQGAPPQREGAPVPKEGAPPEKQAAPPPCRVEVPVPCCSDVDALNKRLDRLECILQQLCAPPCPPAHIIPR
jgi:hypothetical protein